MKTLICPVCKKEFKRINAHIKRVRKSFCSIQCAMEYRKCYLECPVCKKLFYNRGNSSRAKYCSRECGEIGRRNGRVIKCNLCRKEVYKPKGQLKKQNFCSTVCANKYQGRNKIDFICKICGEKFRWSKSRVLQGNPTYCSVKCLNKDTEHFIKCGTASTLKQQKKRGLNKLELAGRMILEDIGVKFNEQVLMFGKFLVDILLKDKKIIIQWDGEYWHNKPKRKKLDESQDAYLTKCGYKILRITDKQIKDNLKEVYANIKRAIR